MTTVRHLSDEEVAESRRQFERIQSLLATHDRLPWWRWRRKAELRRRYVAAVSRRM